MFNLKDKDIAMSLTVQSVQGEEREQEQGQRSEGLVSEKRPAPPLPRPAALYVATTLDFWTAKDGHLYARDVGFYGTCYRRLDPEYFAWLATRMTLAQRAAKAGKMSGAQLGDLSRKFAVIERWAMTHFSKRELDQAARSLDTKTYPAPSIEGLGIGNRTRPSDPFGSFVAPLGRSRVDSDDASENPSHLYPTEGEWRHTQRVTSEALHRVKNSEDEALSLGWTHAQLYQNRGNLTFPCGHDYGLVCHLGSGERVGQITRQYIEIIGAPPRETITRFYNWEVEQPWFKRTRKTTEPRQTRQKTQEMSVENGALALA